MKLLKQIESELAEKGVDVPDERLRLLMSEKIWEAVFQHGAESGTLDSSRDMAHYMPFLPLITKEEQTLYVPDVERSRWNGDNFLLRHTTKLDITLERGGDTMSVRVTPPRLKKGSRIGAVDSDIIDRIHRDYAAIPKALPSLPPILFDPKGSRGFRVQSVNESSDHSTLLRGGGSFVTELNNWLKTIGVPPITNSGITNQLLADLGEIKEQQSIRCEFTDLDISRVYSEDDCTVDFKSCMAGSPPEWFQIYDDLQRANKLKLMTIYKGDTFYGRGLVWCDGGQMYADRVYCGTINSSFPTGAVDAVREFQRANGIEKCVYNCNVFTEHLQVVGLTIHGVSYHEYEHAPYADSLRYLYDGCISTSSNKGGHHATLESTEGYIESSIETYDGSYRDREDCVYSEFYDDYVYYHDAVETDHDGWIYQREARDLYDDTTCHGDYATETYDGTYVHDDEAICITIGEHKDEYGHADNTVQLHNGDVCSSTDDWVETCDGEFAMRDDCIKDDDGDYVLR